MYLELQKVYWEVINARESGPAPIEELEAKIRRIAVEEMNFPPVTVDLFLAADGCWGWRDNQLLAWKLAVRYLYRNGRWLTTEEARQTDIWDEALRAACWAFHKYWPLDQSVDRFMKALSRLNPAMYPWN